MNNNGTNRKIKPRLRPAKAFAYLRVSGKGQLAGDGFPRQLGAIRKYAEANGIKVVRVFEEKGVPGATELDNRPALLELFEALAADGIKLVLLEKLDRLARDLMVQENILADLNKRGFELVSVTEPDLLQKDPARVLMRQIFGAIAQYDKAMIVAKLRGARQRMRAAKGYCEGRKPYGYRPGESEVLARVLQLRRDGVVLEKIADQLNAEAIPTRAGKRWAPATIHYILKANAS